MSRETKIQSFILKKQSFNEADEIVSVFSKEQGKLRFLAKSVKLAKSKLQYGLQTGFLVNLRAEGKNSLQQICGVEVVQSFSHIRENLYLIKPAFLALELCLKATADGEPNENLFYCLLDFLNFLNSVPSQTEVDLGLAKFKMLFLSAVGLSLSLPKNTGEWTWFSNSFGGFISAKEFDTQAVPKNLSELFKELSVKKDYGFSEINPSQAAVLDLNQLLSKFCQFHLERELKTEKLL